MHGTLRIVLTIFAGGWGRDGGYTTFPTVRMVFGGGVPSWQCGRAGHPVGPAVEVVAAMGSTYRADATHLPGRRRGKRQSLQIGRDRQIAPLHGFR